MSDFDDDGLRVVRRGAAIFLRLHEREVQVLQWVFTDLERVIGDEGAADPVSQRLFPHAYLDPTEEGAENQWQALVHGDLVEQRLSALRAVGLGLDVATAAGGAADTREVELDPAQAEVWLGVLNDARLALGTALELTADTDLGALPPDDPRYEAFIVYDWLTHLLAVLLDVVSEAGDGG